MLPAKLCFVDVETTGMRPNFDRIMEIGILRVENGKLIESFESLINPQKYIPEEILAMTGINPMEVENAPSFYELKSELKRILDDTVFVAHNVRFDYSFLKNEFARYDITFAPKHFCTVKLARNLFPNWGHYNLDVVIQNLKLKCKRRHRAFDDASVLWQFLKKTQKSIDPQIFDLALNKAFKKPSVPIKIDPQVIEDLPESSGVYLFYGANGQPLYIGKSINIKERVKSHFSQDHASSKEMKISQQIESIETIKTTGELGALFLESTLIKKMQPLYNRVLRVSRKFILLKTSLDEEGYQKIILEEGGVIDPDHSDEILAIFRSKKQAKDHLIKLAKLNNLCEKLLGLEKTNSACFGYRLGRCKGACVKKERAIFYNIRQLEAFQYTKIKSWPFNGPIQIKEKDHQGGETIFTIDKWCVVKIQNSSKEDESPQEISFDLDSYKILQRFLHSNKNLENVNFISSVQKSPLVQTGRSLFGETSDHIQSVGDN